MMFISVSLIIILPRNVDMPPPPPPMGMPEYDFEPGFDETDFEGAMTRRGRDRGGRRRGRDRRRREIDRRADAYDRFLSGGDEYLAEEDFIPGGGVRSSSRRRRGFAYKYNIADDLLDEDAEFIDVEPLYAGRDVNKYASDEDLGLLDGTLGSEVRLGCSAGLSETLLAALHVQLLP